MVVADPLELLRLLADEPRLRVFSAVVLGARRSPEIAESARLPARTTLKALARLEAGGLVLRRGDGWEPVTARFRQLVLSQTGNAGTAALDDADPATAIVRTFFRAGRLDQIPAQRTKRLAVLDHVARLFEPGLRYAEADVDAKLAAVFTDVPALRRQLVDEGFLAREHGAYWRIGGSVTL